VIYFSGDYLVLQASLKDFMNTVKNKIVFSIVSHGHGEIILRSLEFLVQALKGDLLKEVTVVITLNIPEEKFKIELGKISGLNLYIIENSIRKGFGENHNSAFNFIKEKNQFEWFAVMNPDIYCPSNTQALWIDLIENNFSNSIAMVCPIQTDRYGAIQDFARQLPTPSALFVRYFSKIFSNNNAGNLRPDFFDWVNGAFMIFRKDFYFNLSGFNTRYYMYCEDVDVCLRLKNHGGEIFIHKYEVIHDARRDSRKKLSHIYWHLISIFKLWTSFSYWSYWWSKRGG
jgi:GT2 family glycosyltransferase